jgi:putative drug exporter of the RND superfamily
MRIVKALAGRRGKYVALLGWVALVGALAPFGADFEKAQHNDAASYLPAGSDALSVLGARERFASGKTLAAVVVYRNGGGLSGAEHVRIEQARRSVARRPPAVARSVGRMIFSRDGRAALLPLRLSAKAGDKAIGDAVASLRARLGTDRERHGLAVKVAGPAAVVADRSRAAAGINSTLLIVTGSLVLVLLVAVYRSPVFWFLPMAALVLAELTVRGLVDFLARAGMVVNAQTAGILLVLVFGVGTDYALLLTARYREELRRHDDTHTAMRVALRRAAPTLLASAATVVAALLVLTLAEVRSTSTMGPICALGIVVALLAMLTALPALLLLGGRRAFWPFIPSVERTGAAQTATGGFWHRLGRRIAHRPRAVWVATGSILLILALGLLGFDANLTDAQQFVRKPESSAGQTLIAESFPAGTSAPVDVLVRDPRRLDDVRHALPRSPAVAELGPVERGPTGALFTAALKADPGSPSAYRQLDAVRTSAHGVAGDDVQIGGETAQRRDLQRAAGSDIELLVPLVLAVVLAILIVLLRALVAPLVLLATVALSFAAALGASTFAFNHAFGFGAEDPSLPLFAFVFLVALGVDYTIFLAARVREEARRKTTRVATIDALGATGSVITSAGVVLAGTFAVLALLPLVTFIEIGVTVAFGVLLDTLVARSLLIPALLIDVGDRSWLPGRLRAARRLGRRRPHRTQSQSSPSSTAA